MSLTVVFSPEGKRIASAAGRHSDPDTVGELKVWDSCTGEELMDLRGHTGAVHTVSFDRTGNRVPIELCEFGTQPWAKNCWPFDILRSS